MKIKDRIYSIYLGLKQSIRRFPITIVFSALMAILLIYFMENTANLTREIQDKLIRIQMIVGMGIFLSLCIDLLKERFFENAKAKILISHSLGIITLILYYLFLLKNFDFLSNVRYTGIMIFLLISFFYIPRIRKNHEDYEYYVVNIFSNFFLTMLYSLVLLLGIFAIFFTIDNLFDINIKEKFYFYIFIILTFIFAIPFFLSKVPKKNYEFIDYSYSKALRILLSYIVIPLITIYTVILYIYFAKILISWEWPKGLVSHLVLWYSGISVGIIFLTNKVIEEDKISGWFRKLFPKLILPILLMMFMSIGQRVNQYGITENRYYILALGIWVTGMMVYLSIKKQIRTILIPFTLSLIVLNSVIGPFSSFSVSKFSQNRRLNNILKANNMLEDNSIIPNPDLFLDGQREINNIIYYFNNKHSLKDIKILEDDFTLDDTEEIFGFAYEPDLQSQYGGEEHIYFHTNLYEEVISIKNYDYYVNIASWGKNRFTLEDINISYEMGKDILTISDENMELAKIDLKEVIIDIYDKLNLNTQGIKDEKTAKEMTYEMENKNIKVKLIITNFSGTLNKHRDLNNIYSLEFIAFIKIK